MRVIWPATLVLIALAVGACGGGRDTRKEIEGNNTGGIIPAPLLAGGANAQALADAHCARWKSTARITFTAAETGGDVVFVCEIGGTPAVMVPPPPKQTPATR